MSEQTGFFVIGLAVYCALFGLLGLWLGGYRNRSTEGIFLGLLLGPIGLIITILLPMGDEKIDNDTKNIGSGGGLDWRKTKEAKDWERKGRK